jgi:hypothetical protein
MSTVRYAKSSWPVRLFSQRRHLILCMFGFFAILPACASTPHITYTKKSGVEQLLVARAVDRALGGETLTLEGAKIFVDVASLTPKVNGYFKKALVHQFLEKGALVTDDRKEADLIASLLVKSAGTDGKEFFFGIPSLPVPLTTLSTPQINLVSGTTQRGYAEIDLVLFSVHHGLKEKTAPLIGKSYFKEYMILFIPVTHEDIY